MSNKIKKLSEWINPKLKAIKTDKYGSGMFAVSKIKKGELLAILGGYFISVFDIDKLPVELQDEGMTIHENFVLNVTKKSEIGDGSYFNHSCDPNAGFGGQMFLIAMRDINKGEEITFDYAMTLYHTKGLEPYKMKCLCESKNCRGYITDNDWKIPELQKKYDGYFQYFLQEKINKLKEKQK